MVHLAELNENNICIGIKTVKSFIDDSKHVEIPEPDFDYYSYRKYENGQWSEEKFIPDHAQIELDRMEAVEQAIAELSILISGGAE